jgi:hypothetical protein
MPDRDSEIPADEAQFTGSTGTFDTPPPWGTPVVGEQPDPDSRLVVIQPGDTYRPILHIAHSGSPIEISSADTTLCRLELGADGRWTAAYDPARVDEAARVFLDAVTSVGRPTSTKRKV